MCSIKQQSISGNTDDFTADFSDCLEYAYGEVTCVVIEELPGGAATYSITGYATDNAPVEEQEDVPASERLNPSKVFKWIADKLKETLCPTCM
jgi:hypothetical protein